MHNTILSNRTSINFSFTIIILFYLVYKCNRIHNHSKSRKNIFLQYAILKIYIQSYISTHHNNLSIIFRVYQYLSIYDIENRI